MIARTLRARVDREARGAVKRALREVVGRFTAPAEDLPLASWRLCRDRSGALTLDGSSLEGLLDRWGSPLYVVDEERLRENLARFTARPAGASRGCEVYYSYKTNPVSGVLRRLHALGAGAEVASAYELWLALELGVPPSSVVYNGPAKSDESLELAIERGVGLVNVNGEAELGELAAIARRLGKRPRIGVRVVTPGDHGGQFGERIDSGAALRAFHAAASFAELEVCALHAHFNGELSTRAELDRYLGALLGFCDELHERLGIALEILDVGGNLASPTVSHPSASAQRLARTLGIRPAPRPPSAVLSIDDYVAEVVTRIEAHFATRDRPPPRIFLEPGRAATGDAQMLLCRVAAIRPPDEAGLAWAVLDAGINVAESVRSELHQLLPVAPPTGARPRLYRLTGPSCTLSDLLYPAWELPELSRGDALAIMDAGAYFVPFSTCFSYPRPAVVLMSHGREHLLRRAETFADLVSRDRESTPPCRVVRDTDERAAG